MMRTLALIRLRVGAVVVGRILKRLRLHGLIKKIGKTYKYYLTELGQRAVLVGLDQAVREMKALLS